MHLTREVIDETPIGMTLRGPRRKRDQRMLVRSIQGRSGRLVKD
jgi:hypothetical protein